MIEQRVCLAIMAALAWSVSTIAVAADDPRPRNIILIFTDDSDEPLAKIRHFAVFKGENVELQTIRVQAMCWRFSGINYTLLQPPADRGRESIAVMRVFGCSD